MLESKEDRLMTIALSVRYVDLMRALNAGFNIKIVLDAYRRLVRHHSLAGRAFHTMHRVASCIAELERVVSEAKEPNVILMAIYYQHVVYNALRVDNADASAKYLEFISQNQLTFKDQALIVRAGKMIRCSGYPTFLLPDTSDERLFCDIGRAVLGADATDYDRFVRSLRSEYAYLKDAAWAVVRTNFIDTVLSEEYIFYTTPMRSRYEENARANLMEERFQLQKNQPVY